MIIFVPQNSKNNLTQTLIMKKTLGLITVVLIVSLNAFSQAVKEKAKKSNLETFSEQSGSFSKKEYIELGEVNGVTVSIIRITDIIDQKSVSGIRFSGNPGGSYSSEKTAFIDKDEVTNFLKAVSYINEKVFDSPLPANSEEYNYYARSDFSGGAFSSNKEWKGYLSLDRYSDSTFFFKKDDFKKLVNILQENLSKI